MSEKPLQILLEATDQRRDQFTLSFDSSQYPVTLNPEAITLGEWLRRLHPVLSGGRDPAGDIDPQDLLRNVGTWLWQVLTPDNAPAQERETLAQSLRTGRTPLLLELPAMLEGLPWELLYDPEQSGEWGFLARRRPLMHLSAKASPVAPIEPPLRVLLLISSPPVLGEDSRVDVESERAAVEQALHEMREAGFLHLVVEDIVTPKRVERLLDHFKPHIVHYIGHGEYDQTQGGTLLWEDDQGDILPFSASHLASLLRSRNLHGVVLHGCETARSNARAEVQSMAGTLAQEGLPAILAQQASFTYESSQLASHAWYKALVSGQSMASALLAVRQALIEADRPDWPVPILQGSTASLIPVLDAPSSIPGPPDPLLTRRGAAADLPTPIDVFVGRHRELRALHLMLEDTSDTASVLALITGPGGIGKSTLVAQAVTRYGGSYKAALMLHCQGYRSIDLFLQLIGELLKRLDAPLFLEHTLPDPKLNTEGKIDEAVVALNAAGAVLLIIDNLESEQNEDQTISDKALLHLLQKLLTNLRNGRVLITGRYALPDLLSQGNFAANLLHLNLEDLSPYETNQLLLHYPTLAVFGQVVRQKLVREFGGLPYVYDLLSSKAASQNLELLIHDVQGRVTQECQRRAAEEWQAVRRQVIEFAALKATMSRLSETSRGLLAQLSVLHQPFPLAAIEEGLGVARTEWQPLLDWSLLHYDPQERRYHLHSLTRHCAEGLLEEQPRKQAQMQLAVWYEHYGLQDSHNLADFLEAYRLLRAAGSLQQAGQMVMKLADRLLDFGLYPLLHNLCTKTLSDIGQSDELLVANSLHRLGIIAKAQGEYEQAHRLYQQSLETFERLGNQSGLAMSLHGLGNLAFLQGEYEQAHRLYQQSLETFERLGNQSGLADSLGELGNLAYVQGEYEQARRLYQQSLDIAEQLGNLSGRATILHQLGMIAQEQGEYEQARRLYQQSLDIKERLGDQSGRAHSLGQLGRIAEMQGEYEQAHRFYQQSLDIFERLGEQSGRASCLGELGNLAYVQGEYEQARHLCQQSLDIAEQLGDQHGRASCLGQLGNLAYVQGEYEQASRLYQQCLETFERLGDLSGQVTTLHQLGMIAEMQGEYEQARRLYQQSLEITERLGDLSRRATTLHRLGTIAQEQGEYEQARRLYQQSLEIKEPLGDQSGRASSLHQLGRIAEIQGEYEQARRLYQESLDIKERLGDQSGRAGSLHQLGIIAQKQGKYEQARQLYQESLDIAERLGDHNGRANSLHELGIIAQAQGKDEQAHRFYQESLEIFERLGDQSGRATTLGQLGLLAYEQENFENALTYTIQAYIILDTLQSPSCAKAWRQIARIRSHLDEETFTTHWQALAGDRPLVAVVEQEETDEELLNVVSSLISQGTSEQRQKFAADLVEAQRQLPPGDAPMGRFFGCLAAVLLGEIPEVALLKPPFTKLWQAFEILVQSRRKYEDVRDHSQQDLGVFELSGNQIEQASSPYQSGTIAKDQGRYEEAQSFYQQSLKIAEQLGDQSERANSLEQLGAIAKEQGKYEEARNLYQQSLDIRERLGDQSGQATSLVQLGTLAYLQREYGEARSLYQQGLEIAERLRNQSERAEILFQLGMIAQDQEKDEEARNLYQQSLDIFEQLGNQSGRARSLGRLGMIAYLQEEDNKAQGLYQQSLDIFEQLGDRNGKGTILHLLGVLAYMQRNFERALLYTIEAYLLFDVLQSPSRAMAQDMITQIRSHMDEVIFMTHWRALAGDHPLPNE